MQRFRPGRSTRFNEAAASHRGKLKILATVAGVTRASMRPRHHTAENHVTANSYFGLLRASMRPRHHTAENMSSRSASGQDS